MNKENTIKNPASQTPQSKNSNGHDNLTRNVNSNYKSAGNTPIDVRVLQNSKSGDQSVKLPSLANKFSSWNQKESSLNELDELLAEHEFLMKDP